MRELRTALVVVCFILLASCASRPVMTQNAAPLVVNFDGKGCPSSVPADKSCPPDKHLPPDTVCRAQREEIKWQAAQGSHRDFMVRFAQGDQILDAGWFKACKASKNGELKCHVKSNAKKSETKPYKYVVEVDDTSCPLLDPRIWVQ